MDEHSQDSPQQPPQRRSRRKRPNGRWSNPASPLQAARFELRKTGKEVVTAIRRICPGHSGEPCKLDVAKLSDYETGNRRPGLSHIEAFCRYYQRSPEQLGLIHWRDTTTAPDSASAADSDARSDARSAPGPAADLLSEYLGSHPAAPLLADLVAREEPLGYDAPVHQVLAHVLSETVVLTAITAHLLRASIDGDPFTDAATGPTATGALL